MKVQNDRNMLRIIIAVAAGSAVGGVGRWAVGRLLATVNSGGFPVATFTVNVVGCFVLGLIYGLINREIALSDEMKAFLTVGVCGGFTTFSTFINEGYSLFESSNPLTAIAYITASIGGGLLAAYGAYALTRG
jgi:CrcB protein